LKISLAFGITETILPKVCEPLNLLIYIPPSIV
jgi:hypothetical protein